MNMKKMLIMTAAIAVMNMNACNAANLGDIVNTKELKQVLSSDEMATVFIDDYAICRADTRSGKIMQIDYSRSDMKVFGVQIGDELRIPKNGILVSQVNYNANQYFTYRLPDKSLVRLTVNSGIVKGISWIVDVG